MATKPEIKIINLEDGTESIRQMTDEEYSAYKDMIAVSEVELNKEKENIRKKEEAVARLVSLGLTEDDIRAVMS